MVIHREEAGPFLSPAGAAGPRVAAVAADSVGSVEAAAVSAEAEQDRAGD